jgi:hypothetical protein
MRKTSKSSLLGFVLALIVRPPLYAQRQTSAPAAANATPAGQAPDEVMKTLSDLVHAGKYTEAQQLTIGLLLAYPNDQRLIKAKVLLDKSPVAARSANATPSNPPTIDAESTQPASSTNTEQLTGMDRVDYDALIELARQAQQNTDLIEQKAMLKRFTNQSKPFLQKHPDEMLLWQLRAASAMSLDDPTVGYEAGKRLLAADSNDPNLRHLLAQLKNKGWLDKQIVDQIEEDSQKYGGILGTWSITWALEAGGYTDLLPHDGGKTVFSKTASGGIEAYYTDAVGTSDPRFGKLFLRGTMLKPGEIGWEVNLPPIPPQCCPSGWQPAISYEIRSDKRTMKILVPSQWATEKDSKNGSRQKPATYTFTKISDSQGQ